MLPRALLLCAAGCAAQGTSTFEVPNPLSVFLSGNSVAITFSSAWAASAPASCCPALDLHRNGALLRSLSPSASPCGPAWVGQASPATGQCGLRFLWTVPLDVAAGGGYTLVLAATGQASPPFSIAAPSIAVQAPRYANGMLDPLQCHMRSRQPYYPPPPPPTPVPPTPTPAYNPGSLVQRCALRPSASDSDSAPLLLACSEGAVITAITYGDWGSFSGGCPELGQSPPAQGWCTAGVPTVQSRVAAACAPVRPAAALNPPCQTLLWHPQGPGGPRRGKVSIAVILFYQGTISQ